MKAIFFGGLLMSIALLTGVNAFAGPSMLRISCEGEDSKAEVEINGKFRGECPIDIQVPAGTLQLQVRKKVDAERERLYSEEFRIGEDSVKKVEVRLGAPRSNPKTVATLRSGAQQGNPEAMYRLGRLYATGDTIAEDQGQAFTWYRKAADAGNARAMVAVARSYANGRGTQEDPKQAQPWYQKAADAGNADGMMHLHDCYKEGECSLPKNLELAALWAGKAIEAEKKSAQSGDADAMLELGFNYLIGRGVRQDDAAAAQWFRSAAEAGRVNAMRYLGGMYAKGKGVPLDKDLSVQWYRKAAAWGDKASIDGLAAMGIR